MGPGPFFRRPSSLLSRGQCERSTERKSSLSPFLRNDHRFSPAGSAALLNRPGNGAWPLFSPTFIASLPRAVRAQHRTQKQPVPFFAQRSSLLSRRQRRALEQARKWGLAPFFADLHRFSPAGSASAAPNAKAACPLFCATII